MYFKFPIILNWNLFPSPPVIYYTDQLFQSLLFQTLHYFALILFLLTYVNPIYFQLHYSWKIISGHFKFTCTLALHYYIYSIIFDDGPVITNPHYFELSFDSPEDLKKWGFNCNLKIPESEVLWFSLLFHQVTTAVFLPNASWLAFQVLWSKNGRK